MGGLPIGSRNTKTPVGKGRQKVPRELGEVECVRRVSIVVFPCGFAGKGRNNIQKHKCFCGEKCKVI